jgi:hypothetical protein
LPKPWRRPEFFRDGIWDQRFDRPNENLSGLQKKEKKHGRKNSVAMALTMPSDQEIVLTRVFDAPREFV